MAHPTTPRPNAAPHAPDPALPRGSRRIRVAWALAALGGVMVLVGVTAYSWMHRFSAHDDAQPWPPSFEATRAAHAGSQRLLLDRQGDVLSITRDRALQAARMTKPATQLPWLSLAQWGRALPAELIAIEDRRFAQHGGVDMQAMGAAIWATLQGERRGGSTLSMQLARQLLGSAQIPRTAWGKWQQMRAAWALEQHWSKAQILEAYLNLVPLRGDVRGLHTGAALWLGAAQPAQLNAHQRAWLLAMIPAPQAALARVQARACSRLERQAQRGGSAGFAESAGSVAPTARSVCEELPQAERVAFDAQARRMAWPNASLAQLAAPQTAPSALPTTTTQGSAPLHTALDARTQRIAHAALVDLFDDFAPQGVTDAAAVVLHNATGEVLAYASLSVLETTSTLAKPKLITSTDWAAQPRQTGSILKPLLYAQALGAGRITEQTSLPNVTASFAPRVNSEPHYSPRYNGHAPQRVSPREALGGSLNIPAVHVLQRLGVEPFSAQLHALGLMPLETAQRAGLSLALGSAEARLIDVTNAYRCLANEGRCSAVSFAPSTPALPKPNTTATTERETALFKASAARAITRYLADPGPRGRAFGEANALNTPWPSAAKTGTSNGSRDSWAVGYTLAAPSLDQTAATPSDPQAKPVVHADHYTVGIWMGRRDHQSLPGVYGPAGAGRAWQAIMQQLR